MTSSTAATADATSVAVRHGELDLGEGVLHGRLASPARRRAPSTAERSTPRSRAVRPSSETRARQPSSLLRARDVEDAPAGIARRARATCRGSASTPSVSRAEPVQLVHRRLDAGADVEDAAVAPGRREHRVDDVADVDVVARLLAVAEDERLLAAREPLHEDRDDAALERAPTGAARRRSRSAGRRGRCRGSGSSRRRTSSAASFAIPYARDAAAARRPRPRALDLAVDRAAGRGEDDAARRGAAPPRAR